MPNSNHVVLGYNLDPRTGQPTDPIGVPIDEIDRHLLIAGATGSGKSVTATHAGLSGHMATDGATIVIDPKGDWAEQLVRTHHAHTGTLDEVLYFRTRDVVPAMSFFDVRPAANTAIDRGQAVRTVVDHFLDIVADQLPDHTDSTVVAPDVISYLIRALFDPVEGSDRFSIHDLQTAVTDLRAEQRPPPTSSDELQALFDSVVAADQHMFATIMQGVTTRVNKIYGDGQLRPLFDIRDDDAPFRFDSHLQNDRLLIFDLGGLHKRQQQVLANVILSLLWRALQRRHRELAPHQRRQTLLFIDEVPQLDIEHRLEDLFNLSRGYDLGLVPMMQFPKQLQRGTDRGPVQSLLNNCQSFLVGPIPDDESIRPQLDHPSIESESLDAKLKALPQDRWLFKPATSRSTTPVAPQMIADLPLPIGHPDADPDRQHPQPDQYDEAFTRVRRDTAAQAGVEPASFGHAMDDLVAPHLAADTLDTLFATDFETTMPLLDTLPGDATIVDDATPACATCKQTYPATLEGVLEAAGCCVGPATIDREAIPPIRLGLDLSSRAELAKQPVSPLQLIGLQVAYNLSTRRYDHRVFDPVFDSVKAVLEPLGLTRSILRPLEEEGYLRRNDVVQQVTYSVRPDGRSLIDEPHHYGEAWGHGLGDNTESLLHRGIVMAIARYLRQTYVEDPDHQITRVIPYYEAREHPYELPVQSATRFDVVGLDSSDRIRAVGEAELKNNDRADAVAAAVEDFEQIAAVEPEIALWGVRSKAAGHEAVVGPLGDADRIPSYSSSTKLTDIDIDTPGCTKIRTLTQLRKAIDDPPTQVRVPPE